MGFSLKKICSIFFKEKTKQTCETKWQSPLVPKKNLKGIMALTKLQNLSLFFPKVLNFGNTLNIS
jgi:hypothetical protein